MVYIQDEIHCEPEGPFATLQDAVAELSRRAAIPWDSPPNQAPCSSWQTCGREYHIIEYSTSEPVSVLRDTHALDISSKGAVWIEGFERSWNENGRD